MRPCSHSLYTCQNQKFRLNFLGQISVSEFLEEDMAKIVQLLSKIALGKEYVRKRIGLWAEKKLTVAREIVGFRTLTLLLWKAGNVEKMKQSIESREQTVFN